MKYYTIQEVSKLLNVPAATLRYYNNLGMYEITRSDIGRRLYSKETIERIKEIVDLKQTGISLKEIKIYLDLPQNKKIEMMKNQKQNLKQTLKIIDNYIEEN
ncbi:MAG: MerR family transcriptional regulator [Thomasclavelia sp.]|nr:MerR family transcriptional regulator [Thomasclavelia sp.]